MQTSIQMKMKMNIVTEMKKYMTHIYIMTKIKMIGMKQEPTKMKMIQMKVIIAKIQETLNPKMKMKMPMLMRMKQKMMQRN